MSWTRRFFVLVAFALMVAGVALMVARQEEVFLVLSVAGFALILVAVPSLPREARERGGGPPRQELPQGAVEEAAVPEPPSGAVTVLPRQPADEATLVESPPEETAPVEYQHGETETGPPTDAPPEPEVEEAAPAEPEPAAELAAPAPREPPAEPRPAPPPAAVLDEEEGLAAEAAAAPPAGPRPASAGPPGDVGPPASAPPAARAGGMLEDVSPRSVALAGVAAGALVWLWRRLRR